MNPLILKIATSLLMNGINPKNNSLKPTKDHEDFFSIVKNILNSSGKKPSGKYNGAHEPKSSQGKTKQPRVYLEALRKRLLAKGKPLTEYTLSSKDLPLFKNFLYHCGLSQEKVDQFFQELMQESPGEDVDLSQLFLKMDSLMPSQKKGDQVAVLEPSTIPHIESMLRGFGFTPKELDHLINSAKMESGLIDGNRLVHFLKEADGEINGRNLATLDQHLSHRISSGHEGKQVNITDKGPAGQTTLKDFITSLERAMDNVGENNKLPTEVKNDIEQILERMVSSGEKYVSKDKTSGIGNLSEKINLQYAVKNEGNPDNKKRLFSTLVGKENAVEKTDLPLTIEEKKPFVDKKTGLFQQSKKESSVENKTPWSSFDKHDQVNSNDGSTNKEMFYKSKKHGMPRDINVRQFFNGGDKEDSHGIQSATVGADTGEHKVNSIFSNSIHTAKQNEGMVKDLLPTYLVDQVGKQISKSILRGDKILKLRLKPPELGVLRVEMDIQDNTLKLGVIAEKDSVKDLLMSNVFELRESLIEQGVKLERVDIQLSHDFDQSLTDSDGGLKEGQRWKHESNSETFTGKNTEEGLPSESSRMKANSHLLDLVA